MQLIKAGTHNNLTVTIRSNKERGHIWTGLAKKQKS